MDDLPYKDAYALSLCGSNRLNEISDVVLQTIGTFGV